MERTSLAYWMATPRSWTGGVKKQESCGTGNQHRDRLRHTTRYIKSKSMVGSTWAKGWGSQSELGDQMIFVCMQPFSTTQFGVPFHTPPLKCVGLGDPGLCPRVRFQCCARQHQAHGGNFGKPIQEGMPWLQRGLKAKPPPPKDSIFPSDVTSQP